MILDNATAMERVALVIIDKPWSGWQKQGYGLAKKDLDKLVHTLEKEATLGDIIDCRNER